MHFKHLKYHQGILYIISQNVWVFHQLLKFQSMLEAQFSLEFYSRGTYIFELASNKLGYKHLLFVYYPLKLSRGLL